MSSHRDSATLRVKRAIAVDENGEKQDHAEVELEPVIADLQHQKPAADRGHQQGPEHRADAPPPLRPTAACRRAPARGRTAATSLRRRPPASPPNRATTIMPAVAARRPDSAWLIVTTRSTGTPDILAARAFAPAGEDLPAKNGMTIEDEQHEPIASAMRAAAIRGRRSAFFRTRQPPSAGFERNRFG